MKKLTNMVVNNQKTPTPRSICAIVVTYYPDEGFPERIACIAKQVDRVIIVDNHSSDSCLEMIMKVSTKLGIYLILNNENMGVATALNQGVHYARDCGYAWALTLDQDTFPYPTLVKNLIFAYSNCPFKEKVGIIGSNYKEKNTGTGPLCYVKNYENQFWMEINEVITSGSLMSIPIFEKVGSFWDELFIYFIDIEYCMRLRTNGYNVIIACKLSMVHSTGNCEIKRFLWRNVIILNYPPPRSYYIARNGLLLVQEYYWKETGWALYRLYSLGKRFVSTIIFEDNKILKIRYICLGVYHALISKRGKLDL